MARKSGSEKASVGFSWCAPIALAMVVGGLAIPCRGPARAQETAAPAASGQNVYIELARKAVPSVVNISTLTAMKPGPFRGGAGPEDMFRKFFEDFFRQHGGGGRFPAPRGGDDEEGDEGEDSTPLPPGAGPGQAVSLGTGFIIDASGLILTNNHVVDGADEIKITFTEEADEKPTDGEVVGRDRELDVALIKVKSRRKMVPLAFGDSDKLEVGEYVAAVGNPFGQGHSVTHGIISAKGRLAPDLPLAKYLQTDAPINPGNSGGPLLNLKGEVVGINNAIDARAQGIGFAIPINAVKAIMEQLRTRGNVARGYIGVLVSDLTPELAKQFSAPRDLQAPFVTQVNPGDPADQAGVEVYDVILEFAGKKIRNFGDLISAVTGVPVGGSAEMKVLRKGAEKTFKVRVSERPGARPEKKPSGRPGKKEKEKDTPPAVETGMTISALSERDARELGIPRGMKGVFVESVAYGGPADAAGVLRGDLILEVDRKPVPTPEAFHALVRSKKSYLLRIRRGDPQGRDAFVVLVLELK